MPSTLPSSSSCCDPNCTPVTINIPGSPGEPGAPGTDGADGQSAFTLTGASFTMPAEGASAASLLVGNSDFLVLNEYVFLQGIGTLQVSAIADSTHVTLKNPADTANGLYPENVAPGTTQGSGARLVPAGQQGPEGNAGSTPTMNAISPTTTKGDIMVDNGANNPTASVVRKAAGADGTVLVSDSAQVDGRKQIALTPNAGTDNVIPRFDASGNTTPTPLQSSGMLVTDDGALQSTPTGGNARGSKAVDLQVARASATQVASGANSSLFGGVNSTASGDGSIVAGENCEASGNNSIAIGSTNVVSGDNSSAIGDQHTVSGDSAACNGGQLNIADADFTSVGGGFSNGTHDDYSTIGGGRQNGTFGSGLAEASTIPGGYRAMADLYGQLAHASGIFSSPGDAQASELIWRIATSNATQTEMFLDGASKRAVMFGFSSWAFHGHVIARNTTTDLSAVWEFKGGIKRSSGVVSLIGSVTTALVCDDGEGWMLVGNLVVDADSANVSLRLQVTGDATDPVEWVAHARVVQVHY